MSTQCKAERFKILLYTFRKNVLTWKDKISSTLGKRWKRQGSHILERKNRKTMKITTQLKYEATKWKVTKQ